MVVLPHLRWLLCALWLVLALLAFVVVDASTLRGWVAVTVMGLIPPAILLRIWNQGPPPTVAEALHATEQRR